MSDAYEGWSILALMGHRRLGGFVREAEVAGAKMLRLDVPGEDAARAELARSVRGPALRRRHAVLPRARARSAPPAPAAQRRFWRGSLLCRSRCGARHSGKF